MPGSFGASGGCFRRNLEPSLSRPLRTGTVPSCGAAMKYRLRYQQHDFELGDGQFVIGRGADCQLALDDGLVSRRHAMISVADEDVFVEDLDSRNGVKV